MKAKWNDYDCAELRRKPSRFAAEDVERITADFRNETEPVAMNLGCYSRIAGAILR
jgi:hypothetical protein